MADYSRYKTETLRKMQNQAAVQLDIETRRTTRADQWGAGMRYAKLPSEKRWERAKDRYDEITKELNRRFEEQRNAENNN